MLMEEKLLEERGLAEGMTVVLDEDGTLAKILELRSLKAVEKRIALPGGADGERE